MDLAAIRIAAQAQLKAMQVSAYGAYRLPMPPEDADALEAGIASRRELWAAQDAPAGGVETARTAKIWAEYLAAQEQFFRRLPISDLVAAHQAAPSRAIEPQHALILQQMQARIESLATPTPDLAGRLAEVTGRVLLSTLPTGELNAVTVAVRNAPAYLILFDPVFFSVLDAFAECFSRAIDFDAAMKAAYEYGHSGVKTDLTLVMRGHDELVVENCARALMSLLFDGTPPERFASRREDSTAFLFFLLNGAGLYVTAHEYGHVLLHHTEAGGPAAQLSRIEKEYRADVVAFGMVMNFGNRAHVPRAERFQCIYFFFTIVLLIDAARQTVVTGEECALIDVGYREDETHPCTAGRMLCLDDWLKERYPPQLFLGTQYYRALFLELAGRLLSCVRPALLAHANRGNALRPRWFATQPKFDEALAQG